MNKQARVRGVQWMNTNMADKCPQCFDPMPIGVAYYVIGHDVYVCSQECHDEREAKEIYYE